MIVHDQTVDLSFRETHRVTSVYSAPQYVKEAVARATRGEEPAPTKYADAQKRAYPCDTAASTWLSVAFLHEQPGPLDVATDEALTKAAKFFGIDGETAVLKQSIEDAKASGLAKVADADFALVRDGRRIMPLRNKEETKAASAWFTTYRDRFSLPDQVLIAQKLLQKTAHHELMLPEEIDTALHRTAGYGMCSAKTAAELCRGRAKLLKSAAPNIAQEIEVLADEIEKSPTDSSQPGQLYKIAETIDMVDRRHGLVQRYSDQIPRPIDVLFGVTQQIAKKAASDMVCLTTGSIFTKAALRKLDVGSIRDYMGSDLADAISGDGLTVDMNKVAEILPTLPRRDAVMFEQLASERRIEPVTKIAADRPRMTYAQLAELAPVS